MKGRRRFFGVILFGVLAGVLYLGASLLLTERGMERVYPWAVRMYAEELNPSGNSYAAYYNARLAVAQSEMIVVGVDYEVGESYDALGHFIRFIKQYRNVGVLLMESDRMLTRQVNRLVQDSDDQLRADRAKILESQFGMSRDFADFAMELSYVNGTMTPVRQFSVVSALDEETGETSVDRMLREYAEVRGEGRGQTGFAVVDIRLLDDDDFMRQLHDRFGDRLFTLKMRYSNHPDAKAEKTETTASAERPDIEILADPFADRDRGRLDVPFTGRDPGVYFVCGDRLEWFYNYADRMLNWFRDGEGQEFSRKITGDNRGYFLLITNGTPVIYTEFDEAAGDAH